MPAIPRIGSPLSTGTTVASTVCMSNVATKVFALSFVAVALAAQACTLASPTEVKMVPATGGDDDDAKSESAATDPSKTSSSGSSTSSAASCKLAAVDTSKLTACGDGAGHCYPKSKIPKGPSSDKLMDCPGDATQACVQDTILKAGGSKVKACKVEVLKNAPGACMALATMPEGSEKEQAKGNLKQDACAAGEVCAPCTNPLAGNTDTGLCGDVGVSADDCTGAPSTSSSSGGATTTAAAAACCGGKGSCMDGKVLGDTADDMSQDTCSSDMVCAPQALVAGKATSCTAGTLQGKGICMDKCFNGMLDKVGGFFLDQDVCATNELCVSCIFAKKMAPPNAKVPGCE